MRQQALVSSVAADRALDEALTNAHLLEGIEGDVQAARCFLPADLQGPVDVLEDELDRFAAAVSAVDDVALVVDDDGGCGRACGLQLQLWMVISSHEHMTGFRDVQLLELEFSTSFLGKNKEGRNWTIKKKIYEVLPVADIRCPPPCCCSHWPRRATPCPHSETWKPTGITLELLSLEKHPGWWSMMKGPTCRLGRRGESGGREMRLWTE